MTSIHLNTANPIAQIHFWCEILGGTPSENGAVLPGAFIVLNHKVPTDGTAGSVLDHVCFQINNLAVFADSLARAGIAFDTNPNGVQLMVTGPDGVRVELSENKALATPAAFHHYHFYTVDVPATQRWYAETLGAIPGKRAQFEAADLPGVNLTFSPSDAPRAPTVGRALDSIGFEIEGKSGTLTDPWGTLIQLKPISRD